MEVDSKKKSFIAELVYLEKLDNLRSPLWTPRLPNDGANVSENLKKIENQTYIKEVMAKNVQSSLTFPDLTAINTSSDS